MSEGGVGPEEGSLTGGAVAAGKVVVEGLLSEAGKAAVDAFAPGSNINTQIKPQETVVKQIIQQPADQISTEASNTPVLPSDPNITKLTPTPIPAPIITK